MRKIIGKKHLFAAITNFIVIISCNQIPKSAYNWNPSLCKVNGRLIMLLNKLPLGNYEGEIEYPKQDKNVLVLSNAEELSVFITRQRENEYSNNNLAGEALAIYKDTNERINTFVYAALVKSGDPKIEKKKSFSISMSGIFDPNMSGTQLNYCSREIKGLLPASTKYLMYYIHGAASSRLLERPASIDLDYIVLAVREKNLYLEIAVPAQWDQTLEKEIARASGYNIYSPDCDLEPFDASPLNIKWKEHPALNKILLSYEATNLNLTDIHNIVRQ